jgi:hypothetical protein
VSLVEHHIPGDFCWTELTTADLSASKRFYARVFGWTFREAGTETSPYAMCVVADRDVAAITSGPGARWRSYVRVGDAAATARRAAELGGKVLIGPAGFLSLATVTLIEDPTGGRIAAWQPGEHRGAGRANEPGAMCWNELATVDVPAAKRFYSDLFGWTSNEGRIGAREYIQLFVQRARVAGIIALAPNRGQRVRPQWLVYFATASSDGTASAALQGGGTVTVPPTDIPGVGRFCALRDPLGAVFGIVELAAA